MRRGRRPPDGYLFAENPTVLDVVESQRRGLKKALEELPANHLLARPVDELVAELVEKFRLNVPVLDRDHIVQFPPEEVDIDVTHDPARIIVSRGPHYVKGTMLSIGVPFTGEAALFKYGTSSFTNPLEGFIDEETNTVVLSYSAEHPDAAVVRRDFDSRIGQIASTLGMVRSHTTEWNERLPTLVRTRVTERRAKLERDQSLTLGYTTTQPSVSIRPDKERSSDGVFTDGQQFDALRELQRIIARAKRSIVVIDSYADETALDLLSSKRAGLAVRLLTKSVKPSLAAAAKAFNAQHGGLSIRTSDVFHDRFVIIDDKEVYHFGASLKDAGKRVFRLSKIENATERQKLKERFEAAWGGPKDASFDTASQSVIRQAPTAEPEVKWVNLQYPARAGIEDELRAQGFKLYWSAEDQLAERIDVERWEIAIIERDGKRFILKVADPVRRSLTFMKKRE